MSTAPQTTDDLRAAAIAAEQTPAPVEPPAPQYTELDGIKVGKTTEGKYEAVLPTGARYVADNETQLALNIAKGKVEADRTIHSLKNPAPVAPVTPAEPEEVVQARNYLLNETARGLGFDNAEELKAYVGQTGRMTQEQKIQNIAVSFENLCPEFPNNPENIEAICQIAVDNGWAKVANGEIVDVSPQSLRAAHLIAMAEKKYQPLTEDQIRAQRMQALGIQPDQFVPKTPAPMIPTSAPGNSNPAFNPMDRSQSLDAVRQWAMQAEKNG